MNGRNHHEKIHCAKGDICHWPYQKVEYAQEYDGQQWSKPIPLQDVASADPARYARVVRPTEEPDRYEIVHRKKKASEDVLQRKNIAMNLVASVLHTIGQHHRQ